MMQNIESNLKMFNSSSFKLFVYIYLFLVNSSQIYAKNEFCSAGNQPESDEELCNIRSHFSRNRYILYDVNPPEGFNLRRDVYIRVAVFLKNLIEKEEEFQWKLVLPPWENLYHWRSKVDQAQLPWSTFFDLRSLEKFAPVIEMHQFLEEYPSQNKQTQLDIVYVLQNDEEMFKTGKFEDKNEIIQCSDEVSFHKTEANKYSGYFWGYDNITSKALNCVKFHGFMEDLRQNLQPTIYRSVMFHHMEIPLHDFYGSQDYWKARRSMRYNSKLYEIASEYRKTYLNSIDETDNTKRPNDWIKEKSRRNAIGGPYLSVHLRRRDFLVGRSSTVPTIKFAASQLAKKLNELGLNYLFIATDSTEEEFNELKNYLPTNYIIRRFIPSSSVLNTFKDGGVAIIDQIICSYARYFIGTKESTFTFRIQEDREIIGFPAKTTFNILCKENKNCKSDGNWEIIW